MAVKEIATLDTEALTDAELADAVVELHQLLDALDAAHTRMIKTFDTRNVYAADGAKTASAWLTKRTRAPKTECGSRVWAARQLDRMPLAAEAWAAGEIGVAHLRRLAGVRNPRTYEVFPRDEAMLVHSARNLPFSKFEQAVDYWLQLADPDGCDQNDIQRRDRRRVSLDETISGMHSGHIFLDPISGTIVSDELRRREQKLFEADWAQAKTRLGRDPVISDLARTPDQRRADALVEMAMRSASTPPGAKAPKPLFTLVVGAARFFHLCQLESGRIVSPAAIQPWVGDADLETIMFDTAGLRAIKATRKRSFTGIVRRILEVRDQQCTDPYCEEPPNRCEGDHIIPYIQGGMTSQENGRLACGYNNRRNYHLRPPPDQPDDDDENDDDDDN